MPPDAADPERCQPVAAAASAAFGPQAVLLAERSLRRFVRLAWHVVEPAVPFVPGWHLDAICDHLQAVTEGRLRNLLINVPPRHMKSLAVGVFWPAWEWLTAPHRRWLFASYALSLAERDSLKCRRLIESPWYQSLWADRFQLCGDQNTKLRFENDRAGHRLATSVGGAATGEGGDRVIVDDPHNVIDRESDVARRSALDWWDQTMSTRLNDPRTGTKVIVMQRIHENDLSGHVLAQGGYEHLCLPAEHEPTRRCATSLGWRDPRTAEGELLWPARVGRPELADLKLRLGPDAYAGQFQQRPAPAGGARFRAAAFRYYRVEEGEAKDGGTVRRGDGETDGRAADGMADRVAPAFASLPSSPRRTVAPSSSPPSFYVLLAPSRDPIRLPAADCWRFAVMDPAGTEAAEGTRPCYTVIQVWDVTPAADLLLVHQYRQQVQAPDAAAAAVDVCRRFDPAFIAIEKDGMGLGVVQAVRRAAGGGITVKAIKARGPKDVRSQAAEIRCANGQVYFPHGAPFLFELESELLSFPRGEYCDQVDALVHAVAVVTRYGPAARDDGGRPAGPAPDGSDDESD